MLSLEREISPEIKMETGVIFNRVALAKDLGHGDETIKIEMAKLVDHLANKPGAVDILRSLQNNNTQK